MRYVGIDIGKADAHVSIRSEQGEVLERCLVPNDHDGFQQLHGRLRAVSWLSIVLWMLLFYVALVDSQSFVSTFTGVVAAVILAIAAGTPLVFKGRA